ncbi:DNA phosphorothioation system restriction enzyme [Spirulina sp. CS-785/01]|uniref:DNA phosphorothioation system restriction enzyme n=1 Tax=Spirulina sp. CS-785/01 TaxID=3021716 RepID=UPI003FA6F907
MTQQFNLPWDKIAQQYRGQGDSLRVREAKPRYGVKTHHVPQLPAHLQLRDYQKQAIASWFEQRGRGTLKMATGSGKTIVALAIAAELYQQIQLQVLLVICPSIHLVTQWERECQKFNLHPILAFENVQQWQGHLSRQLYNIRAATQPFLTLITTNATLISEGLQSQLQFFPPKTLIVGDEAHNLGAQQMESYLPRNIGLRLALSATPERYFDDSGTESLFNYFGAVLEPEFTLADAIEKQALVRYRYHPLLVELTPEEAWRYAKLTKRIGWALAEQETLENSSTVTALLMQRSRLIGSAANKLHLLRQLMATRRHTTHTLFYCGDGHIKGEKARQVEAVTRILGRELGYRVNTYTAETPKEEREKLRHQFERGELQGLVAIRCLDEGVDIPAIQTAIILASTGNPRQFIQRRGRILRPHPDKDQATLFDMIVLPPALDRETWEVERNLLRKELIRFVAFAELAENATEAKETLFQLQSRYDLDDG